MAETIWSSKWSRAPIPITFPTILLSLSMICSKAGKKLNFCVQMGLRVSSLGEILVRRTFPMHKFHCLDAIKLS